MNSKILKRILIQYSVAYFLMMVLLVFINFFVRILLMHIISGIVVAISITVMLHLILINRTWLDKYIRDIKTDIDDVLKHSIDNHPMPICIANAEGTILMVNQMFVDEFPDAKLLKTDIKELVGLEHDNLILHHNKYSYYTYTQDRKYKIFATFIDGDVRKSAMLYFEDISLYNQLKTNYENERKCFARIIIDNYDDLKRDTVDKDSVPIFVNAEIIIRQYAKYVDAAIIKVNNGKFIVIFDFVHFDKLKRDKFPVLEAIRNIETGLDFPLTISIGIGFSAKGVDVADEYANFALDLAIWRGGDQVVVKSDTKTQYYGGLLQQVESRTKSRSRMVCFELKKMIERADNVIIMGHRSPDMDAFGSAVAMSRFVMNKGKEASIVINRVPESMKEIYEKVVKTGNYNFITTDHALQVLDNRTLVIVVDTNLMTLVEAPKVVDNATNLVVIDHHRKKDDSITKAQLSYVESNASATSGLIVEIFQFDDEIKALNKLEAELLLGGIYVDTNGFVLKTSSKTFDVIAWLNRQGAHTAAIRKYFQEDLNEFKQRAAIIEKASFLTDEIIVSYNEGQVEEVQIICAKAADALLGIKGVKASFVLGETTRHSVVISARSLGDINVQTILEKMGGGGHFTMAAAQLMDTNREDVQRELVEHINESLED